MSVSRLPVRFRITGVGEVQGEFIRHHAPRTIDAIVKNLPMEGRAANWKEEVYFEIPIKMGREKGKATVEKGAIAYWPMGSAICIFYGETQPYTPVNLVGNVTKNLEMFQQVKSGTRIIIEKV